MNATPRRIATFISAALLALAASTASAQDRPRDSGQPDRGGTPAPMAIGGAAAPNSRLAALIDAGGAPIRTRGVQSVQRIATGVYCIRPAATTNINVNNSIVIVSVDYFYSNLNEVEVQWASSASGCGADRFGVYTLADPNANGIYTFSNSVGFAVYVP